MATQGLVTIKSGDKVLMKVVVGCDGCNANALAETLKAMWPVTAERVYNEATESGFGCNDCLVVITETEVVFKGDDEELSPLYKGTLQNPHFNPRWERGTADYTVIADV